MCGMLYLKLVQSLQCIGQAVLGWWTWSRTGNRMNSVQWSHWCASGNGEHFDNYSAVITTCDKKKIYNNYNSSNSSVLITLP